MRIDDNNIEDVLIQAIQEKAAFERMEELDRRMLTETSIHNRRLRFTSIAAACILMVACGDATLRLQTRKVGYGYDMTEIARAGSSIDNHIANKEFNEALKEIEVKKEEVKAELDNPMFDEQDYIKKLIHDLDELDFTQALCHLRQGKYFKAKKELKSISEDGGAFSKDAAELADKLL